jgi:hypothetical protein
VALVLAIFWLPVSVHCQLEEMPLLDFLSCCPHEETAPHEDDECEGDACAVVESGHYKTEERRVSLPDPTVEFPSIVSLVSIAPPSLGSLLAVATSVAPPGLSHNWRFQQRAALPPRAPSLAS